MRNAWLEIVGLGKRCAIWTAATISDRRQECVEHARRLLTRRLVVQNRVQIAVAYSQIKVPVRLVIQLDLSTPHNFRQRRGVFLGDAPGLPESSQRKEKFAIQEIELETAFIKIAGIAEVWIVKLIIASDTGPATWVGRLIPRLAGNSSRRRS